MKFKELDGHMQSGWLLNATIQWVEHISLLSFESLHFVRTTRARKQPEKCSGHVRMQLKISHYAGSLITKQMMNDDD